jgi:hypothetical protein
LVPKGLFFSWVPLAIGIDLPAHCREQGAVALLGFLLTFECLQAHAY